MVQKPPPLEGVNRNLASPASLRLTLIWISFCHDCGKKKTPPRRGFLAQAWWPAGI